jgi:hypothetical protein
MEVFTRSQRDSRPEPTPPARSSISSTTFRSTTPATSRSSQTNRAGKRGSFSKRPVGTHRFRSSRWATRCSARP